ncbi:MAG: hypothetical protein V7641_4925 [Blastocatellia bacterium]
MKQCPICLGVFSDQYEYCQRDGATLLDVSVPKATDADIPTVSPGLGRSDAETIITESAGDHINQRNTAAILLSIVTVVVLLTGLVLWLFHRQQAESANDSPLASQHARSTISEKEIDEKLEEWRQAWERRDLSAYSKYYDDRFIGRNSVQGTYRLMNRAEWLADKAQKFSLARLISLRLGSKTITFDGNDAVVSFTQTYQSEISTDAGPKTVNLVSHKTLYLRRQSDGGLLIVKEDSNP